MGLSQLNLVALTLLTFGLVACGNMPYKKCVNGECGYYDQDGNKMTEEQAAKANPAFASEIQEKKQAASRQEAIKNAPKREAHEEIFVTILPVETIAKGQVTIDPRTATEWRNLFANSNPLQLTDDKSFQRYMKTLNEAYAKQRYHSDWYGHAVSNRVPGEVLVHTTLAVENVTGHDKATKTIRVGNMLVLRSKIVSTYDGKVVEIKELIPSFVHNQQNFMNLSQKVKTYINTQLRGELPSLAWLRQSQGESRRQASEALSEAAKKWFGTEKKKNP